MKKRNFDNVQIEKHKYRVFECCTISLDTYGLHGVEISQLLWGSFFINANIIELGRLQYELKKYEYQIPNFEMKQKFCLGIHIFRGEKLDRNDVINSLSMAEDKVLSYFRELDEHPKFFIHSWLLAKNLDKYLEEGSNIKYFCELFDIVKYTEEVSITKFLFNTTSANVAQFPEDTSLRRKIKHALLQGEKFYDGIGVLKALF